MQKEASKTQPRDVPRTVHQGIVADAKALDVHRIHLWLVLTGRRQSRSLIKRYRALRAEHRQNAGLKNGASK